MTNYQFYSIMFLLWLIVSYLATSTFVGVAALACGVGYLIGTFIELYKGKGE